MSQKKKLILFGILSVFWSGVIFAFSLQPANQSAELSGGLLVYLLELLHRFTGFSVPPETVHSLFRKLAHFGEFFILGSFAFGFFYTWKKPVLFAVCYSALIALTDETLQFFTGEGRAMRFFDMGIDALGAVCAVLFFGLILHFWNHKRNKR